MNELGQHELFEIEVLRELKNRGLLNSFIFCGDTMLRLCYELNRYSVDLDFFPMREIDEKSFLQDLTKVLAACYEVTDAAHKHNTVLCEVRSPAYPRRLKLEFSTRTARYEWQQRIAFSQYGTVQVIVNVLTLAEALRTKVKAALDRKIIRDFFDIEFILRRGTPLEVNTETRDELLRIIQTFTKRDFTTILGSLLEKEERAYYADNRFTYLMLKLKNENIIVE